MEILNLKSLNLLAVRLMLVGGVKENMLFPLIASLYHVSDNLYFMNLFVCELFLQTKYKLNIVRKSSLEKL